MRTIAIAAVAVVLVGASLPVLAQPSIKPGLWEVTNRMKGNPEMDQAMAEMQKQMAAMPPAQRKQMEEMMAKQGVRMTPGAGMGGMSAQVCMTKEQVERNEVPMEKSDCKVTSQQRSGNTMKMAYTCTNPPSSGEGQYTYHSPESYSHRMTMRQTMQGKTETTTMEGTGKWLSADCGKLAPMGSGAKK